MRIIICIGILNDKNINNKNNLHNNNKNSDNDDKDYDDDDKYITYTKTIILSITRNLLLSYLSFYCRVQAVSVCSQ